MNEGNVHLAIDATVRMLTDACKSFGKLVCYRRVHADLDIFVCAVRNFAGNVATVLVVEGEAMRPLHTIVPVSVDTVDRAIARRLSYLKPERPWYDDHK
jgi:hypothetical protein